MKFVLFHRSFSSHSDQGNVHFLRGVARTLARRGHAVVVFEAASRWCERDAVRNDEAYAFADTAALASSVRVRPYHLPTLDLDRALDGANVVIAHAWNDADLIARLGAQRRAGGRFQLLFHDTHHRVVTEPDDADGFELEPFDAILAGGEILRQAYLKRGWGRRVVTWHEAVDTALFAPQPAVDHETDLIWIGNWSDGAYDREFNRYLVQPVSTLGLRARLHGVGASRHEQLRDHAISFADCPPDHRTPTTLARARAMVDIPHPSRRRALPGVPTTNMFEALACGVPLISAPWRDTESLFHAGSHLIVANGEEATAAMMLLMDDRDLAADMASVGLCSIQARHTCEHRVDALLTLLASLTAAEARRPPRRQAENRSASVL
jgi:spore maturation protein CgeB